MACGLLVFGFFESIKLLNQKSILKIMVFKKQTAIGSYFYNENKKLDRSDGPAVLNFYFEIWYSNGKINRIDGYAFINKKFEYENDFYIDGLIFNSIDFAIKTNHLICKFCNKFCKQGCF